MKREKWQRERRDRVRPCSLVPPRCGGDPWLTEELSGWIQSPEHRLVLCHFFVSLVQDEQTSE